MNTTIVPILLTAFSVVYAVWVIVRLRHDARPRFRRGTERETSRKRGKEIIGRSHVVMTHRSQSVPLPQTQTSTPSQEGKSVGNSDIFAPASVPEHPRQIPLEELDEVFGDVPEGEANEPLEIDCPLYETSFPDTEAEEDENDTEDLPLRGRMLARGVSFEDMGEVYRHVVQQSPIITTEQKEKAGRILLNLKQTDMFEAIVSGHPEGKDKVKDLIDTYLSAFQRKVYERSAESPSPQGAVPSYFDVRNYV